MECQCYVMVPARNRTYAAKPVGDEISSCCKLPALLPTGLLHVLQPTPKMRATRLLQSVVCIKLRMSSAGILMVTSHLCVTLSVFAVVTIRLDIQV